MFNRIYQNFCFFYFSSTTRLFSKILGLGGLRQLPKGRAGPGGSCKIARSGVKTVTMKELVITFSHLCLNSSFLFLLLGG